MPTEQAKQLIKAVRDKMGILAKPRIMIGSARPRFVIEDL
jgi:hypothetical protein